MCSRCVFTVSGRDVEALGDVAVRVPERQELQHLDLARGERLGLAVALLRGRELLGQGDDELRVDHHVAAGDQPHGLDQVLGVASLQDVAAGPAADRLDDELAVVVGGEHDHADLGVVVAQLAGRLQAVHLGHPDVDQRDVRVLGPDQLQELLAVGGLADDLDAVGHVEVAPKPLPHQRVVVRDRDPDRQPLPPPSGWCGYYPERAILARFRHHAAAASAQNMLPVHEQDASRPYAPALPTRTAVGRAWAPLREQGAAPCGREQHGHEPGHRQQRPASQREQQGSRRLARRVDRVRGGDPARREHDAGHGQRHHRQSRAATRFGSATRPRPRPRARRKVRRAVGAPGALRVQRCPEVPEPAAATSRSTATDRPRAPPRPAVAASRPAARAYCRTASTASATIRTAPTLRVSAAAAPAAPPSAHRSRRANQNVATDEQQEQGLGVGREEEERGREQRREPDALVPRRSPELQAGERVEHQQREEERAVATPAGRRPAAPRRGATPRPAPPPGRAGRRRRSRRRPGSPRSPGAGTTGASWRSVAVISMCHPGPRSGSG